MFLALATLHPYYYVFPTTSSIVLKLFSYQARSIALLLEVPTSILT